MSGVEVNFLLDKRKLMDSMKLIDRLQPQTVLLLKYSTAKHLKNIRDM